MEASNHVLRALKTPRGLTFGAWQMLPGRNVSRALCRPGYDWILIDTEHGNIDDSAMHEAVAAVASMEGGVSPVVRVAAGEGWMIKRALDSGAHGIMVPLVSNGEEARKVVSYAKFPPQGVRGFGSPFAMGSFGTGRMTSSEYLAEANSSILTVVQIETKDALDNVDDIAAVEGIDVLFVGPFDLGNSIGYPVDDNGTMHPRLTEAIHKVLQAATKAGKRAGIFCVGPQQANEFANLGFHMVSVVADVMAIGKSLSEALVIARGGEPGQPTKVGGPYGN
ncbi:HpcH/HpaI aldolase/citrate lyase family protein [Peziza echinospora]|nr:HpcH/HpaI aldolase/citrate lyase family protein [Peziza echinospora]